MAPVTGLDRTWDAPIYRSADLVFASCSAGVSVFKPCDEEPCALNNPKRERQEFAAQQGAGGMFGIRIGQGALNECAAWLIE